MDSLVSALESYQQFPQINQIPAKSDFSADRFIIESIGNNNFEQEQDPIEINFEDLYKSLSVTGQKIIDKLNELLKKDLPDGIQSLSPEETSAQATADRIVQGSTAFFDIFAKQNPNLEGEELLNKFMETIKGGIKQGYDDAVGILEDLGAFEFSGVKESIEETKNLIEAGLQKFESLKRQELGLEPLVKDQVSASVGTEILKQAGSKISPSINLSA